MELGRCFQHAEVSHMLIYSSLHGYAKVSGISSYDRLIKIGTDFNEFKSHVAAVVSEKNSNASALFVGVLF